MRKIKLKKTISIDPVLYKDALKTARDDNRNFSNLITLLLEKFLHAKH